MRPQLEIDRAAHRIAGQAILVDVVGSYHVVLPAEVIIEIFKPDADAIVDSVVHAAADRPARVGTTFTRHRQAVLLHSHF